MKYFIIFFLTFLEISLSNIFSPMQFMPLFSISCLVLIYPQFKSNKLNYIICSCIIGLIIDILITDIVFINMLCYFIISSLIIFIFKYIDCNFISSQLVNTLIIIIYKVLSFIILVITGYIKPNITKLVNNINATIYINIVFCALFYILLYKIYFYFFKKYDKM